MIIFFIDLLLFIPFPLNAFSAFNFKLSIATSAFFLNDSLIGFPAHASFAIFVAVVTASDPKADAAPFNKGPALFLINGIIHLMNLFEYGIILFDIMLL